MVRFLRRQFERRWRKHKSELNRSRLRRQIAWCNRLANKDKGSYYTNLITANSHDPKKHSTETALLSIKHEVHLSLASGEPTALVLLDLSAAFDTIDHNILLGYLKSWFGLGGTALRWFAFS